MRIPVIVLFLLATCWWQLPLNAQITQLAPNDTSDVLLIKKADRLRFEKKDSVTEYQMLIGNVFLQQKNTKFYADSAVLDRRNGIVEAYGNVHINDGDSIHTYSQYLIYYSNTKKAFLNKDVKLTDGKGVLTTNDLEYDTDTKIGIYKNGGKVISESTVLTSEEAIYYGDMKDIYFKRNVKMRDPEYDLDADSLLYNTDTKIATFITETKIVADSGRRTVLTSEGNYDLKNKKATFGKRPVIKDGTTFVTGDDVGFDDVSGESYARGNAVFRDTAQGISILANDLKANKKTNTLLATQHPLMIIQQKKDSVYITADTLYSARLTDMADYTKTFLRTPGENGDSEKVVTGGVDSAAVGNLPADSSVVDSIPADSSVVVNPPADSSAVGNLPADSSAVVSISADSSAVVSLPPPILLDPTDTSNRNRYFQAWHHVRIFTDSLQAVCDSLFYSGVDSVFRLFREPIAWASGSQVTGDTMYLFTKNQQPDKIRVFDNGLVINKTPESYYNQLRGNTITGYFVGGNIDYLRARGSAESIYYAQDEDSAYAGVNRSTADIIDMYFSNQELSRVVFRSAVNGTLYPFRQVNHGEMRLRNFKWLDKRRPKTKFELFEDLPATVPVPPKVE